MKTATMGGERRILYYVESGLRAAKGSDLLDVICKMVSLRN
jgi:hypothetical protein